MFDFVDKFFPDRAVNGFTGVDQSGDVAHQSGLAGRFADTGERDYRRMTTESAAVRDALRRQASGQDSLSAEQLRQGLQQQQAMQQSMAASASPQNAAMAARTAAMQAGRNSSGMAGQQATAGIMERQGASQMLGNMISQQRDQDLRQSLGGRELALGGYGGNEDSRTARFTGMLQTPTGTEQKTGFLKDMWSAGGLIGSDRKLKKNLVDGSDDADAFLKGLKAYRYEYKDKKFGKGQQLGITAQDLERTRLGKQAVIDTPEGKMVHAGKLGGALAAATARLGERLAKLEGKRT